ncbi:KAP family NTPase [Rathayibacter caricis]|uniref:KAP family P-loop NTPase fold protein n=1 Tax=Rathayibacter caricis TaxID=110936 RepID=UPI001FB4F11A|nr:P-loop NTPase fold protein [Rathayibacter caricis]MCJ1697594.1 KAP family NTPase [Rathayibacter caricis]
MSTDTYPLFLDEPTDVDLLSFDAVAGTVVDALLDPRLDPIALGLSGSWGSGKTSVLRIIAKQLKPKQGEPMSRLIIETDPWRYDPQLGIKESLIGEILSAIEEALPEEGVGAHSKALVKRLLKRIDWTKAMKLAAQSAVTVTLPSLDSVLSLVRPKEGGDENSPEPITDMVQFRTEFRALLESEGMETIENVVVLVDDLDRCLPQTVVETLETIRLFLSVPKMSFVIAADEERVADAIATRYPATPEAKPGEETPAQLYLHKIVQTSVPVPALSDFDTEAYLVLLQIHALVEPAEYAQIVSDVSVARRGASALETVGSLQKEEFLEQRNNAARIRPIVHEKTKGNPRRIKRFLNDLSVRLSIAARRGITLDAATIAKLMVLEQYFPENFKEVTEWLREQTLRQNLDALEAQAGTPQADGETEQPLESADADEDEGTGATGATAETEVGGGASKPRYKDGLVRWARLSPPLAKKDIAPYLVFAASFKSVFLASEGLPESIRDIATQILSRSVGEARRVSEDMLRNLQSSEADKLIHHVGGVIADEPQKQSAGIVAILRIVRVQPSSISTAVSALKRLRPADLKVGGFAQLRADDPEPIIEQMSQMANASGRKQLIEAVAAAKEGI